MKVKPIVVSIGELFWNIFPDKKQPDGAPFNFVLHASKRGAETYIISAVGNDADGHELLRRLKRAKLNGIVEITNYPTGIAYVDHHSGTLRFQSAINVPWDYIKLTNDMQKIILKTEAIYFGIQAQRSSQSRHTIQLRYHVKSR